MRIDGIVHNETITHPLRQPRVWLDFGKLVLAAVVQGVVVSAIVALVVMVLASGAVAEPADARDAAGPAAAAVGPGALEAQRTP
ncbi:MAG: hypothetical protein IT515_02755 [Burkholderiales bacterium]|nr:hypothetical protein [Burkholderiales bacterium]